MADPQTKQSALSRGDRLEGGLPFDELTCGETVAWATQLEVEARDRQGNPTQLVPRELIYWDAPADEFLNELQVLRWRCCDRLLPAVVGESTEGAHILYRARNYFAEYLIIWMV